MVCSVDASTCFWYLSVQVLIFAFIFLYICTCACICINKDKYVRACVLVCIFIGQMPPCAFRCKRKRKYVYIGKGTGFQKTYECIFPFSLSLYWHVPFWTSATPSVAECACVNPSIQHCNDLCLAELKQLYSLMVFRTRLCSSGTCNSCRSNWSRRTAGSVYPASSTEGIQKIQIQLVSSEFQTHVDIHSRRSASMFA